VAFRFCSGFEQRDGNAIEARSFQTWGLSGAKMKWFSEDEQDFPDATPEEIKTWDRTKTTGLMIPKRCFHCGGVVLMLSKKRTFQPSKIVLAGIDYEVCQCALS